MKIVLLCASLSAPLAWAQSAAPVLSHQSVFSRYQKMQEATPTPAIWRTANQVVDEVGGWRAYLKEVQSTAAPKEEKKGQHEHHK